MLISDLKRSCTECDGSGFKAGFDEWGSIQTNLRQSCPVCSGIGHNLTELGQNYIISGKWATFRQIADIVSNQIDRRTTYITFPFWTAYTALPFAFILSKLTGSRPSFSRGSLHALAVQCKDIPGVLAQKKLGHSPRPLKETVQDTIKWMQENAD